MAMNGPSLVADEIAMRRVDWDERRKLRRHESQREKRCRWSRGEAMEGEKRSFADAEAAVFLKTA